MDGEVGDRNRKIKKEEEEESGNSSTSAARANFQQFLPFFSLSLSRLRRSPFAGPYFLYSPYRTLQRFPKRKKKTSHSLCVKLQSSPSTPRRPTLFYYFFFFLVG